MNAYRPTLNQLWVEACSRVEHRYREGEIGALQRMNRLVLALRRLCLGLIQRQFWRGC